MLKHENLSCGIIVLRMTEEYVLIRNREQKFLTDLDCSRQYKVLRLVNSSLHGEQLEQQVKLVNENGRYVIHINYDRAINRHLNGKVLIKLIVIKQYSNNVFIF